MANVDRPNGFRPVATMDGAPMTAKLRRYPAADRSADSVNNHGDIYIGDPVNLVNGEVLVADSNTTVAGIVVGTGKETTGFGEAGPYNPDNLEQQYLAYDEPGFVWIVPVEDALFEVQTAAALDLKPGQSADSNITAGQSHGSRITSQSNAELVAAVNFDVYVVENVETPDNDTALANARHKVLFQAQVFVV